jgi:hypothetical protein
MSISDVNCEKHRVSFWEVQFAVQETTETSPA